MFIDLRVYLHHLFSFIHTSKIHYARRHCRRFGLPNKRMLVRTRVLISGRSKCTSVRCLTVSFLGTCIKFQRLSTGSHLHLGCHFCCDIIHCQRKRQCWVLLRKGQQLVSRLWRSLHRLRWRRTPSSYFGIFLLRILVAVSKRFDLGCGVENRALVFNPSNDILWRPPGRFFVLFLLRVWCDVDQDLCLHDDPVVRVYVVVLHWIRGWCMSGWKLYILDRRWLGSYCWIELLLDSPHILSNSTLPRTWVQHRWCCSPRCRPGSWDCPSHWTSPTRWLEENSQDYCLRRRIQNSGRNCGYACCSAGNCEPLVS